MARRTGHRSRVSSGRPAPGRHRTRRDARPWIGGPTAYTVGDRLRDTVGAAAVLLLLMPTRVFAQSPWERAASSLEVAFTGPIARSLALVAIVIGGLTFMFGEAGAKRALSGIVFGGGLALFAGQFLLWLF